MAVAEVLAHHARVLALGESVVVAVAGAGLGELPDAQLVEQGGDTVVDVLGAVVGVNALNHEGERLDKPFEHRQQEALGDGLHGPHELELGHVIDHVDVVDAPRWRHSGAGLGPIVVSLMHGIDTHIAGLAARLGLAPLPDGVVCRLGLAHHRAPAPIGHRAAQSLPPRKRGLYK